MRPAEFPPESIIEAGQALQATGRNVTGFALRQRVGGGNPSRLKQIWDEYVSRQSATKIEPVAELPIEVAEEVATVTKALTDRLNMLAVELNDKAVKAAERRVAEVIRTSGEQREQADRELADASETVDDLESKLDQMASATEALESKLVDLHRINQAQAVELAQVRERLALTEQSAKTAAVQHTKTLQTMTEQHAAELERMNASIEADRARHQHEANQLRVGFATAKANAEASDKLHQEQRKTAEYEAQRAEERISKAEAGQEQATKEANTAREEAANLRGQVEAIQNQTEALMRALSERK